MDAFFCSFRQVDECRKIDILQVPNVCKQLTEPISLLKSIVKSVRPPISCPIKEVICAMNHKKVLFHANQNQTFSYYLLNFFQGRYHVENQVFDLGLVRRVPIDPGNLNVNLTVFDYIKNEKNQTKKQFYVCLDIHVTLTPLRSHHKASNKTSKAIN